MEGNGVAHWEMVVKHDQPGHRVTKQTCAELVRRGEMVVTQPARLVLGGLASLGTLQQIVCLGCGAELEVVRVRLIGAEHARV